VTRSSYRWLAALLAASLAVAGLTATGGQAATIAGGAGGTGPWTGTWATALTKSVGIIPGLENQSIRMIVQTSVGGTEVRLRFANTHGEGDLVIGQATVARPAVPSQPDLDPATIRPLTFGGRSSVTVAKGTDAVSDPVAIPVAPLSQLAVTIYLPRPTGPPSFHLFARQRAFIYDGNHAGVASGGGVTESPDHLYFLTGVEVRSDTADGAVAVLGASISDGFAATQDANTRWPDFLARRIVATRPDTDELGVLNVSLSGNAINHDGDEDGLILVGPKAIDRLDDHVRPHARVRTVIVDLGLNDIFRFDETPAAIIDGLHELAADLHRRGYRVLLATLSPAAAAPTWTSRRETTRQLVNHYIRTGRDADGVVDIDRAIRDPRNPTRVNPLYASPDGVHPNDTGNRVIADAVALASL
jgi:lysophospholipase L1-like esterase